jgi:hypothetical protein
VIQQSVSFFATATSHTLTFQDVTLFPPSEASAIIDNISIASIPEARPYIVILAGLGLAALYGLATRARAH